MANSREDSYKLAGLTEEEYQKILADLKREPNPLELSMYGVLWSEHCSYKHTKKLLKYFPTEGEKVLQGPGENAGVLDGGDGIGLVFKIESHNHPSAVEPYQGAATGVGGIVRDIFSMGARPVALLNSLRFGSLNKQRNRYLLTGVVKGIGDYGNCLGIPDVGGEVYFHSCYDENPLVNAMCLGLVSVDKIKKGIAQGIGNVVMLVGAATGRDGIKGASFASANLEEDNENKRPSVQVGDPFMEKLLLEACMELVDNPYVVGVQDLGAAGLTSSACEMAARGKSGLELNLDKVHVREENMSAMEIMLSESQERMLYVVKPQGVEEVKKVFAKWDLQASEIGKVTDSGKIEIYYKGKLEGSIPTESIVDGVPLRDPLRKKPAYIEEKAKDIPIKEKVNYNDVLKTLIADENICSRKWIYSQYDYMVGNNTILRPGDTVGAVRIQGTTKAVGMTVDCNPLYPYLEPYHGGMMVVLESYRNLVAGGFKPLGITNCLNYPNPEDPENYYVLEQSIKGIAKACQELNTPVTGGNVSLYNQGVNTKIYPTPVIGMVGLIEDYHRCVTTAFKGEGELVYLVGELGNSLGGSIFYQKVYGYEGGKLPDVDFQKERNAAKGMLELITRGLLASATDISQGGLAIALIKSCIKGKVGVEVELGTQNLNLELFAEGGGYLVSVKEENALKIEEFLTGAAISWKKLGKTQGDEIIIKNNKERVIHLHLKEVAPLWETSLERRVSGDRE